MRDAASVITEAAGGFVEELRNIYEVSTPRMYEILSKDNPYPKAKRLIRAIAAVNPDGVALIKADIDAMFATCDLSKKKGGSTTPADLHREAFEAVQALLADRPRAEQQKELRELVAAANDRLSELEDADVLRDLAAEKTIKRFGGRAN